MVDERALALARSLEADDARLAAALADVARLHDETAALRTRAAAVDELLRAAPERMAASATAVEEAGAELDRRRDEAAGAEAALADAERSRDEQRLASARRAVERTRESVASGGRRLERTVAARAELERATRDAEAEAPELEAHARALSEQLEAVPRLSRSGLERPEPGLDGVDEWASRVAAALFVVRSGLETERERVIREANELAASVLGETGAGTSVPLVRARLERA